MYEIAKVQKILKAVYHMRICFKELITDFRPIGGQTKKRLQKGGSQTRTEKAVKIDDAPNKVPHVAK